jgi:hypothetical protein
VLASATHWSSSPMRADCNESLYQLEVPKVLLVRVPEQDLLHRAAEHLPAMQLR